MASLPGSVVALDGKHQATLSHGELLQLAQSIDPQVARVWDAPAIQRVVQGKHPQMQVQVLADGTCRGLIRYHRVTLTSHPSSPCLALVSIPGNTNEVGQAPATLRKLFADYRNSSLIDIVTADAGNTSAEVARVVVDAGKHYLLALKGNQPETEREAHRLLDDADAVLVSPVERVRGQRVQRRLYVADVTGVRDRVNPYKPDLLVASSSVIARSGARGGGLDPTPSFTVGRYVEDLVRPGHHVPVCSCVELSLCGDKVVVIRGSATPSHPAPRRYRDRPSLTPKPQQAATFHLPARAANRRRWRREPRRP